MLLANENGLEIKMYLWKQTYFDLQETMTVKRCFNSKFDVFVEESNAFLAVACKELKAG